MIIIMHDGTNKVEHAYFM